MGALGMFAFEHWCLQNVSAYKYIAYLLAHPQKLRDIVK